MIEFNNVSFKYEDGSEILSNLNLKIRDGEVVLLCGESGCGKSTIARLINALIPHYYKGELEGQVLVNGLDTREAQLYEIAEQVASVFQNPKTQFYNVDSTEEMVFGLENRGVPREEMKKRLEETVKKLGMEDLMNRNLFAMSGGEKQKVACACADTSNAPIIVLDEPSSNLDIYSIKELAQIIAQWKKEGKTVVVAEHRLYYMLPLADRVIYMNSGKVSLECTPEELIALGKERITQMGLRSTDIYNISVKDFTNALSVDLLTEPEFKQAGKPEKQPEKIGKQPEKPGEMGEQVGKPEEMGKQAGKPEEMGKQAGKPEKQPEEMGKQPEKPGKMGKQSEKPGEMGKLSGEDEAGSGSVLRIKNFSYTYKGEKKPTLTIDGLTLPKKSVICIVGDNGAGKSTFARTLCGIDKRADGILEYGGERLKRKGRLKKTFMVMQDVAHQLFTDEVEDELESCIDDPDEGSKERIMQLLEKLNLKDKAERHPQSLSGGEKQRVAIGSAVIAERDIIVFDEPTSGLDYRHMASVAGLVKSLKESGKTIFIITHDPELIAMCCDELVRIEDGKVVDAVKMTPDVYDRWLRSTTAQKAKKKVENEKWYAMDGTDL
ncbi:MAG: energy-coupling factor ABC transporter ATP-binding protein [Lachnospiraceae bacterium]|nr:energy-coupling factor ABC transporter ATP-binding protein [Lachnospiraceae bacterium]